MNVNSIVRTCNSIRRCQTYGSIFIRQTRLCSNTPSEDYPPLPPYQPRQNETLDVQKARLLYQSRKRGMLENGLLLSTFAAKHLESFNESDTKLYDELINIPSNDWEIYYWAIGNKPTPKEYDNGVMDLLKKHACNENMDNRTRQPDLS